MSGFREFKYSVITLICAVLLNVFIISILYWIFNVRKFPPVFSRDSLNNTSIVLTVITILITRFLIAHYDISLKQKKLNYSLDKFLRIFNFTHLSKYSHKLWIKNTKNQ
jgi:hypothetical protein